jgi:hypothetical protein
MLIKAKIIYKDIEKSDLLGKNIIEDDEMEFELDDCNGIIPQKEKNRYVIILSGSEFLIETKLDIMFSWRYNKTTGGN